MTCSKGDGLKSINCGTQVMSFDCTILEKGLYNVNCTPPQLLPMCVLIKYSPRSSGVYNDETVYTVVAVFFGLEMLGTKQVVKY